MAVEVTLKGEKEVLNNFKKETKKILKDSKEGLIMVGLLIKASSMRRTPIDLGNLRASHYVVWDKGEDSDPMFVSTDSPMQDRELVKDHQLMIQSGRGTVGKKGVQVGVSANYAIYVHEDLEANHTVGEAKFFSKAIAEITPQVLKTIRDKAKVL